MKKFSTSLVYFCVIFSAILLLGSYQNVEAFAVRVKNVGKGGKGGKGGREIFKDSMVKNLGLNLVAFYQFTHYGAAL